MGININDMLYTKYVRFFQSSGVSVRAKLELLWEMEKQKAKLYSTKKVAIFKELPLEMLNWRCSNDVMVLYAELDELSDDDAVTAMEISVNDGWGYETN